MRSAVRWLVTAASAGGMMTLAVRVGIPRASAQAQLVPLGTPVHVDGVAAYVGGGSPGEGVRVVLQSDVELRARLSLFNAGGDALTQALTPELLQATLAELLGEALIAVEASRLGLASPSARDVRDQRARLAAAGRSEREFQELVDALEVSPDEIDEIAKLRAIVGAFLSANLEGTLDVSESELVRAYETEEHPFQGLPYAAERVHFAAWMQQKRLQEAVGRWVHSLKERIPHRVLIRF